MEKGKIKYSRFEDFYKAIKVVRPNVCIFSRIFFQGTYMFSDDNTIHILTTLNDKKWHTEMFDRIEKIGVKIVVG